MNPNADRIAAAHARDKLAELEALGPASPTDAAQLIGAPFGLVRRVGEPPEVYAVRLGDLLRSYVSPDHRPEPMPHAAAAIDKARTRVRKMPVPPSIARQAVGPGDYRLTAPHADVAGWRYHLFTAFGTRSGAVANAFVAALDALYRDHEDPDAVKLNAALAIVADAKPRNAIEAGQVAQLVMLNWLALDVGARALRSPTPLSVATVARVTRAYSRGAETLAKLQGKTGRQIIKVRIEKHDHRHMHVHEGGRHDSGSRPDASTSLIPHRATALEHGAGSPLPGQDPQGNALPVAGIEGEGALPSPRRRAGIGRTAG